VVAEHDDKGSFKTGRRINAILRMRTKEIVKT